MVMKKNVMGKNLRQSIVRSLGRYLAIVAIIALGAGLFVGLLSTKTDMVHTAQNYMDQQNMFDLRLLNTYGWDKEMLDDIRSYPGVQDAEGTVVLDVIGSMGTGSEEGVYQLYPLPDQVNKVFLLGGRMPQAPNECLADGFGGSDRILGTSFTISDKNSQEVHQGLVHEEYTIVGYVATPLFMDMTRSNTTLGDGKVDAFVYLPKEAFDFDYFTEIGVTLRGDYKVYTEDFDNAMDNAAEAMKPGLKELAWSRYDRLLEEAWNAYHDGSQEYEEGLKEYQEGKAEARQELNEAFQQLLDAQEELEENERKLQDGLKQLEDAQRLLKEKERELEEGQKTLDKAKADALKQLDEAYQELVENQKTVEENLAAVEDGLMQLNQAIALIDVAIAGMDALTDPILSAIELAQSFIDAQNRAIELAQSALEQARESGAVDESILERMEQEIQELIRQRDSAQADLDELKAQLIPYAERLRELQQQREELAAQRTQVQDALRQLQEAQAAIEEGFEELERQRAAAMEQFDQAQAEIDEGRVQLAAAKRQLNDQQKQMDEAVKVLEDGRQELNQGWSDYYQGEADVNKKLNEAKAELDDAAALLADAREQIDSMVEPQVYALTRNTNVGYLAVDSNSDIVAGVSRVFPAFFLLVAALMCITTMTRMVEEERTQIGTLKALGYSNGSIISKYLIYAGSAAIAGCGLGVLVGSVVFPSILWQAYGIILTMKPDLDFVLNVPLCIIVVVVYTALMLFVTWTSCRLSLRQVPAELIRPKAPTSGKKILLEYLPFWKHFRFLDKVMVRNIFRYRQRLLMMLAGVCGCTALLVTGFGIGDSIKDIVSYQFQEITLYDMQVQYSEGLSAAQQKEIRQQLGDQVGQLAFAHQSSVDLTFKDDTRNIYMIAGAGDIMPFYSFHSGSQVLELPGEGETMLSIGAAEAMGIDVGDTVTLTNSDLQELQLTVSGIFENNVYNYAFVSPNTIAKVWGAAPEQQIAYVNVAEGVRVHDVSAKLSGMDKVMNVMVSQDLAEQVGSMLSAMDMIVLTVVVCAGLLAVIVLYNLTNINITERLREIATIKVLGFNSRETALYVFKENLVVSIFGAGIGLLAGKLLLDFVMSQIKIDMVWFQARILPFSLLISVGITILMALLVDFLLYFRLEKINMAEALKSVE